MIDLTKSRSDWPWRVKIRRGIWTYLIEPLVRWLPKSCSSVRVVALRLMGASIGHRCLILPGTRVLMPWNLELGDFVAIGEGVNFYNFALITVGRMTVISQFSFLCTGTHDYTRAHMPLTWAPIRIGEQSWLAADVFVGPGVSIPDGVVVGARSLVVKSLLEPWSVYAGHPCQWIKTRTVSVAPEFQPRENGK